MKKLISLSKEQEDILFKRNWIIVDKTIILLDPKYKSFYWYKLGKSKVKKVYIGNNEDVEEIFDVR